MAAVVFPDGESARLWIAEIGFTPDIEGGAGPVKMGTATVAADGRWGISHPYHEVDLDWIEAYTAGAGVEIFEKLPGDLA